MKTVRRAADFPRTPGEHRPEFMAHLENCSVVKSGIPVGAAADPPHRHPFDQFYFVLEGHTTVQLGTDRLTAAASTLVRIPEGVTHFAGNYGTEEVLQVEILLPTPIPATGGRLIPIMELNDELGGPPPAGCLRAVTESGWRQVAPTVRTQPLASRATGSPHGMIAVTELTACPEPAQYRIHPFDELYFVLSGELNVDVGGERQVAGAHDLVVVPAGVPYRVWNAGGKPERHLTILTPEPVDPTLAAWTTEVSFTRAGA
jgi:mannose-6-phosphate isomerase-like protein (cupin superfamily)